MCGGGCAAMQSSYCEQSALVEACVSLRNLRMLAVHVTLTPVQTQLIPGGETVLVTPSESWTTEARAHLFSSTFFSFSFSLLSSSSSSASLLAFPCRRSERCGADAACG